MATVEAQTSRMCKSSHSPRFSTGQVGGWSSEGETRDFDMQTHTWERDACVFSDAMGKQEIDEFIERQSVESVVAVLRPTAARHPLVENGWFSTRFATSTRPLNVPWQAHGTELQARGIGIG